MGQNQLCAVGSSRIVIAPLLAPITTRLPHRAQVGPRRSTGSHREMRPAPCEQVSQPVCDTERSISWVSAENAEMSAEDSSVHAAAF
jgi:hypothetical protein